MIDKRESSYKKAGIFNLKQLQRELDAAEVYETPEGGRAKAVYLGSALQLFPSGKFYLPFACRNLKPCPACQGKGAIANKRAQSKACKRAERQEALLVKLLPAGGYWAAPEGLRSRLDKLRRIRAYYQPEITCKACNGLGSREAWLDECWRAHAEEELESLGASLETGEGDPLDLFAVVSAEEACC